MAGVLRAKPLEDPDADRKDLGAGLKAAWFGAEAAGNLAASLRGKQAQQPEASTSSEVRPAMTRDEIISSIKEDYEQNYFVTGAGAMDAYSDDALYSDPFVSFRGTNRFKQNVSNLGAFIRDVQIDITDWEEQPDRVTASWRFSAILDLPWRPRLAAAGSTTHVMDLERGLVVQHVERWKAEPGKVVASLLKPASKVPTSRAEAFMMALTEGDAKGMWFNSYPVIATGCAPVVAVSLLWKVTTGHGLPGTLLGGIEGLAWLGLAASGVSFVVAAAQQLYGGETGSGGRF